MPGMRLNDSTSAATFRRNRGSPPVRRTRSNPRPTNTRTSRSISSNERMSSRGSQTYSSSGMQYWQRRLQRSVTETRRLRSGRARRSGRDTGNADSSNDEYRVMIDECEYESEREHE